MNILYCVILCYIPLRILSLSIPTSCITAVVVVVVAGGGGGGPGI